MKKYENYKDSGLEWLGMVPEHWEIMRLKSCSSIILGKMLMSIPPKGQEANYSLEKYLKSKNVGWLNLCLDDNAVEEMFFNETEKELYKLREGDIVMNEGGDIGKVALWHDTGYDCYIQNSINKITSSNGVIPAFLTYYLYSVSMSGYFWSIVSQISIAHLTKEKLANTPIILPPLTEQRTIASYLDRKVGQIDALISGKEKMVEDLKAYRSSLITETVTKGLDKGVEMKDSGDIIFKSIPQHWNLIPIKYLTSKVGSGVTPTGGANVYLQEGIIFLRSQNIYPTGLQLDDVVYISEAIDNNMAATRVNKGDVLLNITGASIGRCFTYNRDERANVNQHVCIVRPKQTLLNGKYLQYLFNSNAGQNFINSVQNGTNREGLNFEQIKNFSVPVPSLDEQQTIIKFLEEKLSKIDALQIELEHQLSDLKSYKSSLITEAVTGKIDLRDWQTKKS